MLIGAESLAAFELQAKRLAVFGYKYIPEYERALPDRRFFKRVVNGVRTHHVHVVEKNGVYWKRYLKFRNALRDDGWIASRYAELKRRLAARHSFDRDAYTNGKRVHFRRGDAARSPAPREERPPLRSFVSRVQRCI